MAPTSLIFVPLAFVGAITVSACGRVGVLEQPAPLYGAKAKADYQARKAAEAARAKTAKDTGEPEPLPADTPSDAPPPTLPAAPSPGAAPPADSAPAAGPGPHAPSLPGS